MPYCGSLFIPWRKFRYGSVCKAVMHSTQQLCTQNHVAPQSQINPGLVKVEALWQIYGSPVFGAKPLFDPCWWVFLLIGPLGTKFNQVWTKVQQFSYKKMDLKMLSARRRPVEFSGIQANMTLMWRHCYTSSEYVSLGLDPLKLMSWWNGLIYFEVYETG